ncbi:transcription initiation factor IIA subunit 2-like [Chenopodium quinoa]|uniref:transcription initiation factor IIA subunit 2-like n=1 Tax=Chenopodium quinoa TaxID=63459 RepID=UPI000B7883E0|nr:transcription initiation factor IIA subunit 2-like [Chenopodium quinoa]
MEKMKLYRNSTIGCCLLAALEELVHGNSISKEFALKVVNQFDKSMLEAFQTEQVPEHNLITFKGKLQQYKFIDSCWTFDLLNAVISARGKGIWFKVVGNLRIMAFNGKLVNKRIRS